MDLKIQQFIYIQLIHVYEYKSNYWFMSTAKSRVDYTTKIGRRDKKFVLKIGFHSIAVVLYVI